ncbi:MAG: DUF2207 domain-containing protein, partial [Clostridia bacterium]|nr:DUF2207 domain-containing protein [Clostridia bacterium]
MSTENIIVASLLIAAEFFATFIPLIIGVAKKRRVIKPVEYLPPRGASPLDVMLQYYGAKAEPREIFNPLMLYWADRGFITIEEDCKRGLKLSKLKDLEPPTETECFNPKTYDIEVQLFNCIFANGRETFYTLAALSGFKEFYGQITNACGTYAKRITDEKSRAFKTTSLITSFLSALAVIFIVGLSIQDTVLLICIFPMVSIAFPKLIISLPSSANDGMPKGSVFRFLLIPFFLTFGGIPMSVGFMVMPYQAGVLVTVALIVCAVNVFILSNKIDVRTNEQLISYARICGFKKFLLLAEARQLEELVEDDPGYYYNILPYCYVLKITEKMKAKFDTIALDGPAWYLG